jgi:hypothetical protein
VILLLRFLTPRKHRFVHNPCFERKGWIEFKTCGKNYLLNTGWGY